ncbi:uncharacterized protein K460DRAFT_67370 [Cucurbitaria berberidis CBS 394.84]|uniref:EGF-like domain-containing protein n=1 Tax=Cucurbitaria berberidis CBS 394.84 TaxID=1168544 RepID=A0A9P4LAG9_9PLEO|nr:uncharacterized protein K460DRAFT_67370 [Cucurbitaria berberidis CBS 394.84]KAF1848045.1 hypothetical protein K460DRAFT_67370 [Cucurbitaria berberidis CBS 394.84]
MKAFVLGALLLRTLNAQVTDDADASASVAASSDFDASAAPLLTPGPSAPSEAELSSSEAAASAAEATSAPDTTTLPVGTADVILDSSTDSSSALPPTATIVVAFGSASESSASETSDAAVIFDSSGFTFPTSTDSLTAASSEVTPTTGSLPTFTDLFELASAAAATDTSTGSTSGGDFPATEATSESTISDEPSFPEATADTSSGGVGAADATDLPGDGSGVAVEPPQPGVTETASSATTDSAGALGFPSATASAGAGAGFGALDAGGFGAQAAGDPNVGMSGQDAGDYDGQDYGDDDDDDGAFGAAAAADAIPTDTDTDADTNTLDLSEDECPWWCYDAEDDDDDDDTDSGPDFNFDDSEDGTDNKRLSKPSSKRALRARQEPASSGFATFNWPDAGSQADSQADSSASSTTGSQARQQEAEAFPDPPEATARGRRPMSGGRCSPRCYNGFKPTATASRWHRPTYTRTRLPWPTRRPWTHTHTWHPEPTVTEAPETTFVTQIVPPPAFSSVLASDVDWTGATLAGICPKTCDPFHPDQNKCDITTSCATTGGSKYYCACRAGYSAGAWNAKDFSKQFHVDGQPYVYVAPGVACDKVCTDQTCSDVLTRPACK